jgi:hypothetical protein
MCCVRLRFSTIFEQHITAMNHLKILKNIFNLAGVEVRVCRRSFRSVVPTFTVLSGSISSFPKLIAYCVLTLNDTPSKHLYWMSNNTCLFIPLCASVNHLHKHHQGDTRVYTKEHLSSRSFHRIYSAQVKKLCDDFLLQAYVLTAEYEFCSVS